MTTQIETTNEKKAWIEKLLKEAKKHKNDASIIKQLKKETQTLRSIMQSYIRTIDSLGVLNKTLTDEKTSALQALDKEREKQTELVKQKEELQTTISKGSLLFCSKTKATAVFFRKSGKKEVETARASKAEKIKVSFMLGENRIAKMGPKDVYLRIITPGGQEMTKSYDASNRFTVVEVSARDRPALLNRLARALFESKLLVHSAHIATYGERAADTFYVTDLIGEKVKLELELEAVSLDRGKPDLSGDRLPGSLVLLEHVLDVVGAGEVAGGAATERATGRLGRRHVLAAGQQRPNPLPEHRLAADRDRVKRRQLKVGLAGKHRSGAQNEQQQKENRTARRGRER